MNNRLDFVIRKNKGKLVHDKYFDMFVSAGFYSEGLKHVDLSESDSILDKVRVTFRDIDGQFEILSSSSQSDDSKLILSMLYDNSKECYVFSDDVYYCGMYRVSNGIVKQCCLNVAKDGYSNTCFVLDTNFQFFFTINFHHEGDPELKNMFDIQLKSV